MTPEIVSSPAPLEPGAAAGLGREAAQAAFAAASGPFTLRPRNSERAPGDPTALAAALLQERPVPLELQRAGLTGPQAGPPPPLLVRGATARPLGQPAGILLGAGHGEYDAMTMILEAGDVLLLYSDGLVERRDRPLDEGLATLARAAAGV